jgi:hypothetical protein
MTPADAPMPPTDRLSRPSHRRTLLPNRPVTLRALAVSRQPHSASPVRIRLWLFARRAPRFGPLETPLTIAGAIRSP